MRISLLLKNGWVLGFSTLLGLLGMGSGQTTEFIECYSNNCTTLQGNITTCQIKPNPYLPLPSCRVPAATGLCYVEDWPATSTRVYGCITQRSCPFNYKCCASGDMCNCDTNFPSVVCANILPTMAMYPINATQPFIVNADYTKTDRYYVFEVWTNFTRLYANVTFTITSVSPTPSTSIFGIMPGTSINSAKIFIEAGTNLELFLNTYTLTITATSTGNAIAISQQYQVRITPIINHAPTLTSPNPFSSQLFLEEDSEVSKKLVTVCASDADSNLDIVGMCRSMLYEDFDIINDPSHRFFVDDTGACDNPTTASKASFCVDLWTKAGAIFSVRDESRNYPIQIGIRDSTNPPAYLHVFFNVTIVPRETTFWRYCFVCNKTSCPFTGPGPSKRCLPGQHYCCKRILNPGSKLFWSVDRFCSNIRADDEYHSVSCCSNNFCNDANSNLLNAAKLVNITLISLLILLSV